jgi:ABC-type transporter Mla maintaining outer membrane lipid asymmetry ATPase subunit MlaF
MKSSVFWVRTEPENLLMKSIVGALKIDEGEIIFNGKNITENEIESKKDRFSS